MLKEYFLLKIKLKTSEIDLRLYWSIEFDIFSDNKAYSEDQVIALVADLRAKSTNISINDLSESRRNPDTIIKSN